MYIVKRKGEETWGENGDRDTESEEICYAEFKRQGSKNVIIIKQYWEEWGWGGYREWSNQDPEIGFGNKPI